MERKEFLMNSAIKSDMFAELQEAVREASHLNWDGDGALPVDQGAKDFAEYVLSILPLDVPRAEICATATGDVMLEWGRAQSPRLSVRVKSSGKIAFAFATPEKDVIYGDLGFGRFHKELVPKMLQAGPP